jgi:hypothetical protein
MITIETSGRNVTARHRPAGPMRAIRIDTS